MSRDPIGYDGGANLYEYCGGEPVGFVDPLGLRSMGHCGGSASGFAGGSGDLLANVTNFFSGWGDTLSFGGTKVVRGWLGADDVVDYGSGAYMGGQGAGFVHSVAMGRGFGVLRDGRFARGMWRPNSAFPKGKEWIERSHWFSRAKFPQWANSKWNIKPMWGTDHALADEARRRFLKEGWKRLNPLRHPWLQFANRIPRPIGGMIGGAGYGGASIALGAFTSPRNCD